MITCTRWIRLKMPQPSQRYMLHARPAFSSLLHPPLVGIVFIAVSARPNIERSPCGMQTRSGQRARVPPPRPPRLPRPPPPAQPRLLWWPSRRQRHRLGSVRCRRPICVRVRRRHAKSVQGEKRQVHLFALVEHRWAENAMVVVRADNWRAAQGGTTKVKAETTTTTEAPSEAFETDEDMNRRIPLVIGGGMLLAGVVGAKYFSLIKENQGGDDYAERRRAVVERSMATDRSMKQAFDDANSE